MAVAAAHLTDGASTTNATSYSTASITPTAGRLVLLSVEASTTSGTVSADPTVSGNGLTWVLAARTASGGQRDVYIYRAMGTPSAGAVTVDFGATGMGGCNWSVTEYSGTDTSGVDGSVAIAQTHAVSTSALTSINHAFPSTVTSGSATHAAVGWIAQETGTAGSGWTALSSTFVATPSNALLAMNALTAQQNITASWTSSSASHTVGVEIKAASTGSTGSGAGAWSFAGSGTGTSVRSGTGVGSFAFTGSGTGSSTRSGSGLGSWSFAGSGSGAATRTGSGSGLIAWAGSGTGTAPSAGAASGSGAGLWSFTGAGSGARTAVGSGTSATTWAGAGGGTAQRTGAGGGLWSWVGSGMGAAPSVNRPVRINPVAATSRRLAVTTASPALAVTAASPTLVVSKE